MKNTKIEWAHHTFNPWVGCTKVSPACDHCYAENLMASRMHVVQWGAGQPRKRTSARNWTDPLRWNAEADRLGVRYRVFCASLADVFDNEVPAAWRADLFDLIEKTPHLDWLLLTKRIGNVAPMMVDVAASLFWMDHLGTCALPSNVWLGATICNQAEADRDIQKLLTTPARVRFLSMEPLLGPVDLTNIRLPLAGASFTEGNVLMHKSTLDRGHSRPAIDWVIVGGESGPQARPMHPDWVRSLRDQCATAGVPFLFKQWGEWRSICQGDGEWWHPLYRSNRVARSREDQGSLDDLYGRTCRVPQLCLRIDGKHATINEPNAFLQGTHPVQAFMVGKKAAGRLLDGRTWDEVPG